MFKSAERKKSQGFTLAEVLIVVAIIVILLAVAIPNIISYYRSLKLTELDDSARTIFMAAQNRLTAMKSAGEDLSALSDIDVDENAGPGTGTGKYLAVTETQTDSLDSLVPGGSIESQLHDNHYVVEIDAKTGAVYAVWYWEKEDFDYKNESYDEVKPEKDKRLDAGRMVGYYGGSFVVRPNIGQTPMPSAQVINAEELKLEITVPGYTGGSAPVINATVTLSDRSGHKVTIINEAKLDYDSGPKNIYSGTIVLDTLDDTEYDGDGTAPFAGKTKGKPFKEWVETYPGSGIYTIEPGANFDIEVKVTAVDPAGSKDYLPQYIYWTDVNSLFDSVDGGTAKIAYGRHLQNLDNSSGVTSSITGAVQVRDIDFDATGVDTVYSWFDTYKKTAGTQRKFTPIKNDNLTSYDGADHTISELIIDETGENVGLFSDTDAKLDNIRLVNADVKGGNNVGALAGQYNGSAITNCGAHVDEVSKPATVTNSAYDTYKVTGTGNCVGGLVGNITSAAALSQSFASVKVTGATDVGGLVGLVNSDSTFTDCYSGGHTEGGTYKSDANVTGTTGVGGLVGSVADGKSLTLNKINYSTCSVKTSGTALETGLLVGTHTGANGTVIKGSDFEKAYATGEAFGSTGAKITIGLHDETAYLGTDRGTNTVSDFITVPYDETLKTTVYPYATNLKMHYGDWVEETASASSLCYYEGYVGGTEYNLWGYISPDPTTAATLVKGLDGTSGKLVAEDGYCIPVLQGQPAPTSVTVVSVDSTKRPAETTTNTYDKFTKIGTYTYGGNTYDLYKIDKLLDTADGVKIDNDYYHEIDLGGAKYWFNPFFACEIQKDEPSDKTKPGAKEGAAGTGSTLSGDFDGKVVIRTARQLANLADATGSVYNKGTEPQKDAQEREYVQLLDIDYNKYDGNDLKVGKTSASRQKPASLSTGSYDGNHFLIRNLYLGDSTGEEAGTGLFGRTRGEMKNIRLVNISVTDANSAKKGYVGALAGRFQGDTVTDCGVYVDNTAGNKPSGISDAYTEFKIEGADSRGGSDCVGGLIGGVNSEAVATFTSCFAAVKVESQDGDRVGGLIGSFSASQGDGKLINCYAGGHTSGGSYDGTNANVIGAKQVGGLIGYVPGSTKTPPDSHTVTISGINYSTCSVKSNDNKIGLLIGDVDIDHKASVEVDTAVSSTAYAVGAAYGSSGEANPREETYLTSPQENTQTDFKTHAYDGTLTGDYPYQTNLDEHYGDWPPPVQAPGNS